MLKIKIARFKYIYVYTYTYRAQLVFEKRFYGSVKKAEQMNIITFDDKQVKMTFSCYLILFKKTTTSINKSLHTRL